MTNFGPVPIGSVLPVFFSSYAGSTGASVTLTGLAVTDIEIYKGTSMTQRASDAGYALLDTDGIDVDGITGIHAFSIDTGDNTDSGFFEAGSFYTVVVSAVTVDSQTVNFVAATFRLTAAESSAGVPKGDVSHFGGTAGTFSGGRPEVNTTHAAGTAWGSGAITAASIAADAITAAKIADGAIDAATFAAGAINAAAIASDAITDAKVASDVTIASVTGAVGSVTGNVGGNVTGSVGSIATGGISAASFAAGAIDAAAIAANAIGASELAADAVAEIADAVWDEALSGHLSAGSTGEALNAAGAAGDPWTTALPGAYSAGQAGYIVGTNLNATISSRASQTSVDTIDGIVDSILIDTAEIGTAGAGLSAIPWNAAWDAEVQSEAMDALNAYDPPTKAEMDAGLDAVPTATENADALLNRDMSAVSDTNSRSPLNALRHIRNKWSVSGTTLTVTKEDDTTSAWTSTLSTNASADPITGSDPA